MAASDDGSKPKLSGTAASVVTKAVGVAMKSGVAKRCTRNAVKKVVEKAIKTGGEKAAKKVAQTAVKGVAGVAGKEAVKGAGKFIPFVSLGFGVVAATNRWRDPNKRDTRNCILGVAELGSGLAGCFPGLGTGISIVMDVGVAGLDIHHATK